MKNLHGNIDFEACLTSSSRTSNDFNPEFDAIANSIDTIMFKKGCKEMMEAVRS